MKSSHSLYSALMGALLLISTGVSQVSATLVYDFEGSLDGWTNVRTNTDNTPPQADSFQPWQNVSHSLDPNSPRTDDGTGASGTWQIAPHVSTFSCCPQDNQPQTLVLTSPVFTLDAGGVITFALTGGTGAASSPATGNFNTLPTATSTSGFEGVALRNAATGAYLLSATKSSVGESYVQLGFSNSQLATAGVLNGVTPLRLDLINNFSGGWGWIALDNVTIVPEPSSVLLLGFGALGLLAVARRRKAA